MNTKPEALRLADELEEFVEGATAIAAAAELRRQHGEIESMRAERLRTERRLSEVEKQRDELLEALREIGEYRGEGPYTTPWQDIVRRLGEMARAAIAKTEGKQ